MSVIAKVILYPLVVPVVMFYELTCFAWRLISWRHFLVGFLAYVVGPLISVLGGLELASHLGWQRGFTWPMWLGAFFAFQLAFLGVFWPLFVTLLKPVLWVVSKIVLRILESIDKLDRSVWRLSADLGSMMPGWQYWRMSRTFSTVASPWYSFLVLAFIVLSLAAHFIAFTMPIWAYFNLRLGSMAPWLTIISHFTILCLIAISPLFVFGLFGARAITSSTVAEIYGPASLLAVLDLLKWTNLLTNPPFSFPFSLLSLVSATHGDDAAVLILSEDSIAWAILKIIKPYIPVSFETLCLSVLLYFVIFIFLLPIGGILSLRSFFREIILVILNYCILFHRWAMQVVIKNTQFHPYLHLCTSPIIAYATYTTGTFFGLHPYIVWLHTIVLAAAFYPIAEYPVFLGALSFLATSQFMIRYTQYLWAYTSPLATIGVQLVSIPLLHAVVIPLLALPLWPFMMISFFLPRSLRSLLEETRTITQDLLTYIMNKWDRLLSNSFDDRSSFQTMFGWLMTATLVTISAVNYTAFFFLSGTSPIFALQQLGSFLVPDVKSMFVYQNINDTTISVLANATLAQNSTNLGEISANLTNTTATVVEAASASIPALLGHRFVDAFVFLAIVSNVFILCGKLASQTAAPSFVGVTWILCFSYLRQSSFMHCHYRIFTELFSAELSIALALLVAPAIYGLALFLCRPFVPKLAPLICIPFERLWTLQQWMVRVWIRNWHNFLAFCAAAWDSVFGAPKPVKSDTPMYARPRRYG